jgi:methyl-accepting chemotaxis protein
MLNRMSLRAKLIAGFSAILIVLVVLSTVSLTRFISIRAENRGMVAETENRVFAISKEIDHLQWVQGLTDVFLDDSVNQVTVETDPTKCSLGQWMYGGELERLAAADPELAALVEGLKGPHAALHSSAIAIGDSYREFDADSYDRIVDGWIDHLSWIRDLSNSLITGAEFTGSLDHTSCDFGRWYYSYRSDDPQLMALLARWDEPHRLLHDTAGSIVEYLRRGDLNSARSLYRDVVLVELADLEAAKDDTIAYLDGIKTGQNRAVEVFAESTIPALTATQQSLMAVVDYFRNRSESAIQSMEAMVRSVILLVAALAGAALLLGVLMAILTTSSILSQLGVDPMVLEDVARKVSLGDLEISFDDTGTIRGVYESVYGMVNELKEKSRQLEEIGDGNFDIDVRLASENDGLGGSMLRMRDSMSEVLREIQMASNQVSISAEQIAQSSTSLSQGATEQAASLEEISSSLTEINSQSQQNADNAREANVIATRSAEDARTGNNQMIQLVSAMEAITESSKEIQRIVKVIDDIAFQTNLLALNANVEAARSGKYGKGFAVVADEVRNLANRSAGAVKDTGAMVETALSNIRHGDELVRQTAEQLAGILSGSEQVSVLLQEISQASSEQSGGLNQITDALEQIDQVTQANTASAEQSSAAAEELSGQARLLDEMLRRFRLSGTQGISARDDGGQRLIGPR